MKFIQIFALILNFFVFSSVGRAEPSLCAKAVFGILGTKAPTSWFDHYADGFDEAPSAATVKILAKSPNATHRLKAIEESDLLDDGQVPLLLKMLADADDEVRTVAIQKLAFIPHLLMDKSTEVPLGKALMDSVSDVRNAAVHILMDRMDKHSLASIEYAIFKVRNIHLNELSWQEFYQLKLGALEAFNLRADEGAVLLIDKILREYFSRYSGLRYQEQDFTKDWELTLLNKLVYMKRTGSVELQRLISALVKQREWDGKWSIKAEGLFRTPVENDPGLFAATALYDELVRLPNAPGETQLRLDLGIFGTKDVRISFNRQEPPLAQ